MLGDRRTRNLSFLLGGMAILVLSFQNFSNVTLEELRPELNRASAASRGEVLGSNANQDIREFAPTRPNDFDAPEIALPDSGRDSSTIGLNWLGKQTHLMTNGGDQRVLDDINRRLQRLVKFTPVEGEPWPESGDSPSGERNPTNQNDDDSNSDGNSGNSGDQNATPQIPKNIQDMFSHAPMAPHSIKFTQLNRFDVAFNNSSHLNCMVGNGGLEVDFQKPLSERMNVGLKHQTSGQASTVHLNYSW